MTIWSERVHAVSCLEALRRVLTDPGAAQQTLSGANLRLNGPLHVLSLIAGAILVSRRFKQDENWRPIHRTALTLSLVMLGEFIAVALATATESGFAGLGQRVFIATNLTWMLLAAARLRSLALGLAIVSRRTA